MIVLTTIKSMARRVPGLERFIRFVLDRRYRLARRHLQGTGIEIGALDRPLWLPRRAQAYYLDHLLPADLRRHYPELNHRRLYVSLVSDGEAMDCIRDGSLDFVVANHVIEHCEDPIATLMAFSAKLKSGGVVFMAVPDMRLTFDHHRTETSYEHLLADHEHGPETSRIQHMREWAEFVEGREGAAAEERVQDLMAKHYSIHFHCWTRKGFETFLDRIGHTVPLRVVDADSWRNENIFILRRS